MAMNQAVFPYNLRMPIRKLLLTATLLLASLTLHAQSPITTDPAPDKQNPAAMQSFQLPSHGALLNAFVYIASGAGPHPTVILLHGFPGNEKNLDLAQSIRRAGWNVLYFNYRGSWGSPGDFSFTHCIEDVQSAIAYLRDPANAKKLRVDSTHLVLIGHSMGGFMAPSRAPQTTPPSKPSPHLRRRHRRRRLQSLPADQHDAAVKAIAAHLADEGMAPLAGTTPESSRQRAHRQRRRLELPRTSPPNSPPAPSSSSPPTTASPQPTTPSSKPSTKPAISRSTTIHMTTDHAYSDHRIALQQAILDFLKQN